MPIDVEGSESPSADSTPSPMPVSPMPGKQQLPPELQSQAKILALIEKTGYSIVQENGQRRYGGPPPDWPEDRPAPCRGCEVFVGKIPRDAFEDELVPLFETCGKIYEVRLMMNFGGENRGYAFVMFTNKSDALRAIRELNNFEIRKGRSIGVCLSVDNCRLFIGGIPKNKTKEETLEEMKKITTGVVDVIMYPSIMDKTKNRGFAFVEYESHKAAAMARRKLIPGRIQLWGQQVAVDWAEPERSVDDDTMSKVKILYLRNLQMATTEQQIEQMFTNFLQKPKAIERVKKINDFAFVHFNERDDALRCLEKFNNSILDNSFIEITLAKPPDKNATKQQQQQQQQQQHQGMHAFQGSPVKMVSALEYNGIPLLAFTHPQMPLFGPTPNGALSAAALQQFAGAVRTGPNVNASQQPSKFSWKASHSQMQPQQQSQQQAQLSNGGAGRGMRNGVNSQAQFQQNFGGMQPHPMMMADGSMAKMAPNGNEVPQPYFGDPALAAAAMLAMGGQNGGYDASALLQQNKLMSSLQDVIKQQQQQQSGGQQTAQPQTPTQEQQQHDSASHSQQSQLQPLLAQTFVPSSSKVACQLLEEFCVMNGLPGPAYQLYVQYMPTTTYVAQSPGGGSTPSSTGQSNDEANVDKPSTGDKSSQDAPRLTLQTVQTPMFACVITLPGLLSVSSPRFSPDQNEAKNLAALLALTQLGAAPGSMLANSPTFAETQSCYPSPPLSSSFSPHLSPQQQQLTSAVNCANVASTNPSISGSFDSLYSYLTASSSTSSVPISQTQSVSNLAMAVNNLTINSTPPLLATDYSWLLAPEGYFMHGGVVPVSPVASTMPMTRPSAGAGSANQPFQILAFPQPQQASAAGP